MKTKTLAKILVVLTVAAALFAGFSPAASARGDSGDQKLAAEAPTTAAICIYEGANICPLAPFENIVICITTSQLAGYECPDASHDEVDAGEKLAIEGGTEAEICIIEGANICPPEPFELIAPCITTSQLAGYECPDWNDAHDGGTKTLAARR